MSMTASRWAGVIADPPFPSRKARRVTFYNRVQFCQMAVEDRTEDRLKVEGGLALPRAGSRTSAKSLLLTLLGEFVLPRGGRAWTGTLVDVLGALGVEGSNARQAIARTASDGRIIAERHGRRVQWQLSDQTVELLDNGTKRIYGFGSTGVEWDRRWLVVLCPVPEEQRAKRHQLRARLGFAGFGFL